MRSILSFFKKKPKSNLRFIQLDEVDSTNNYAAVLNNEAANAPAAITVVSARHQVAGRGQGTHTWHSEEGKNLLFSILCHPVVLPLRSQFLLSETFALSLFDVLSKRADGFSIKWPNDIYWHDKKVAGTLIENKIAGGHIKASVIGTGLNVNQATFPDDLPNPVSLLEITGKEENLDALLHEVAESFERSFNQLMEGNYAEIACRYMTYLYRNSGFHPFRDKEGTFEASIIEVEDDGHLILRLRDGSIRSYAFQEVTHIITQS